VTQAHVAPALPRRELQWPAASPPRLLTRLGIARTNRKAGLASWANRNTAARSARRPTVRASRLSGGNEDQEEQDEEDDEARGTKVNKKPKRVIKNKSTFFSWPYSGMLARNSELKWVTENVQATDRSMCFRLDTAPTRPMLK